MTSRLPRVPSSEVQQCLADVFLGSRSWSHLRQLEMWAVWAVWAVWARPQAPQGVKASNRHNTLEGKGHQGTCRNMCLNCLTLTHVYACWFDLICITLCCSWMNLIWEDMSLHPFLTSLRPKTITNRSLWRPGTKILKPWTSMSCVRCSSLVFLEPRCPRYHVYLPLPPRSLKLGAPPQPEERQHQGNNIFRKIFQQWSQGSGGENPQDGRSLQIARYKV